MARKAKVNQAEPEIAAVILAGGRSQRFGEAKVLQSFQGKPFIQRIIASLHKAQLSPICLVLGYDASNIRKQLPPINAAQIVINEHPQHGQFSSLQTGVNAIQDSVKGVLVCLVDQPHLLEGTYRRIMQTARSHPDQIVIPTHRRQNGHPVYLPAWLIQAIRKASPTERLNRLLKTYQTHIVTLEVDDRGILEDIDTRDDLKRIESQ